MKTEIVGNTYENGKRVSNQRVYYDKSDDLFTLANLQRNYENICTQLDDCQDSDRKERLAREKTRLESELEAQETLISGYVTET